MPILKKAVKAVKTTTVKKAPKKTAIKKAPKKTAVKKAVKKAVEETTFPAKLNYDDMTFIRNDNISTFDEFVKTAEKKNLYILPYVKNIDYENELVAKRVVFPDDLDITSPIAISVS